MIRIIYNWQVAQENTDLFIDNWKIATNIIHKEVSGARGSFLLISHSDSTKIKTIARWDSLEDWKKFWHDKKHFQMQSMHELGDRISQEIFEEVDDFTF